MKTSTKPSRSPYFFPVFWWVEVSTKGSHRATDATATWREWNLRIKNLKGVKKIEQVFFCHPPKNQTMQRFTLKKWQSCRFQVSSKTILLPKLFWAKGVNLRFVALQLSKSLTFPPYFWGVRTGGPWAPVPVEASGNLPRRRWGRRVDGWPGGPPPRVDGWMCKLQGWGWEVGYEMAACGIPNFWPKIT